MKRRLARFGLPLLARELAEQASLARTYIVRVVCAAGLFAGAFYYFNDILKQNRAVGLFTLGYGGRLFRTIFVFQIVGILLLVPAITCGAIAHEKERNTLSVLLTTRLGPWTIVMEKLLSRLFVTFTLLLLSMPLWGFAYAMGGLTLGQMTAQVALLASLSLLVASTSLMCSAWCGSTVSAFFMTYAVGVGLCIGSVFFRIPFPAAGPVSPETVLAVVMPVPSVFFLLIARECLVRRAFVAPRNFVLGMFRSLDRVYNRINARFGNVILVRDSHLLPGNYPIAWRETSKKSLGTFRYLVRVLVAIELPVSIMLMVESGSDRLYNGGNVATGLWYAVWCIATALTAVTGASLIGGERSRQTLPVLLATPIPGNDIVLQLAAGVRRLVIVLWIPLATIAVFQWWFHRSDPYWGETSAIERLDCSMLQMVVYLPLVAWMTIYLGAKIRSPMRAVIASLLLLTAIIVVPLRACDGMLDVQRGPIYVRQQPLSYDDRSWLAEWAVFLAGPAGVVILNERHQARLPVTLINFLVYGGALYLVRRSCLKNADRLLGRAEASRSPAATQSPAAAREEIAAV